MSRHYSPIPASLPLLLWKTPPGLEQILAQEGVPFDVVRDPHPLVLRGGRFVLFDGRSAPRASIAAMLGPDQVAIDVDAFRRGEPSDPFAALIDPRSARATWTAGFIEIAERVSRHDKGAIRRRLIGRLRDAVTAAGGVWIRLATFPHPYRSAFSFRADLDEPSPDDYFRYARARAPLDDCCTHFVSTDAYAQHPSVLRDLKDHDTQSHGHFHHVYRDAETNRLNLERAHRILVSFGFDPAGFAAPHGRWSPGLDDALEDFGYLYSSDFQLGYDDLPFFPRKHDRFSRVLQIPVHPICEGLFLEAGITDGHLIGEHVAGAIAARLDHGELAIAYGHPERRLANLPEVLQILARTVTSSTLTWRTTFTGLSRWWRWRAERRWLVLPREDHRLEIQFSEWDPEYALAIEIHRGDYSCSIPVTGPRMTLGLEGLAFHRADGPQPLPPPPRIARPVRGLKQAIRAAIDWETVTPLADIPATSLPNRVKRGLRWWKARQTEASA
jgi:hypothetical protein